MKKLLLLNIRHLIISFLLLLFCSTINGQIKILATYSEIQATYYDNYGTFDKFKLFHDQSLINFEHSEERALVSYYSNTSKSIYDKYVLTNEARDVVYHIGSETKGKVETIIYNDFDSYQSKHYQSLDSSQTWINIYFRLKFKYNEENISIVSYRTVENGYPQGRKVGRFVIKLEGFDGQVCYIDKRKVLFLDDLTRAIGLLKKETIRILLGIDKPKSNAEKELLNLVTSSGESLQINILVDLYNEKDERLMKLYR